MGDQIELIVLQILVCKFFNIVSVVHSEVFIIMYRNHIKMYRFSELSARIEVDLGKE